MNNKNLSNKIATIAGLFLGAFALSALAIDWTPPTANPPANNTKAPINVSASPQAKEGPISIGKVTNPTTGYKLDVAGSGMFTGLLVTGKTITDTLQIGSTNVSRAGYVLTNKDGTGEAEWKPNTSGLSGASRIYCAAASDGASYYIPESGKDSYDLINKINTEVFTDLSSGFLWNDQLLNTSDPKNNTTLVVGLLRSSFNDTTWTKRAITTTNAPKASCNANKKLVFHSMVGWAKDERDFNDLQQIVTVVKGDYTANSISCIAKGQDRPTLVIGMGLCI